MRIVLASTDYLPNIGGVASHVYNLAKSLAELGHEVIVLNPVTNDGRRIDTPEQEGFVTMRIPYRGTTSKVTRALSRCVATLRAIARIETHYGPIDVIHVHDQESYLAGLVLRRKMAVIWTNHTSSFVHAVESREGLWWWRQRFAMTDGIIAVSREIGDMTRLVWPGKDTKYVPNGVDAQRFSPRVKSSRPEVGIPDDAFVVLCPRRMVEKNGVVYLARAAVALCAERPDVTWRFLFLGSSPLDENSAHYIELVRRELGSLLESGEAIFVGNVAMNQMPALNACADVVVVPSLIEAVSLAALEAMASRKPVVASGVGGLPEIVQHEQTGLLVEPRSEMALKNAILRILNDPQLAYRISDQGYRLAVEKYGWNQIADQTIRFYESVLARR